MRPYFDSSETIEQLLAVAQSWVGTPYSEKRFTKGVGTDCSRFLWQIWAECGFQTNPETRISKTIVGRGVGEHGDRVVEHIIESNSLITEVGEQRTGDIVMLSGSKGYRHFVLLLTEGDIIHCDTKKGVVIRKALTPQRMTVRSFRAWRN